MYIVIYLFASLFVGLASCQQREGGLSSGGGFSGDISLPGTGGSRRSESGTFSSGGRVGGGVQSGTNFDRLFGGSGSSADRNTDNSRTNADRVSSNTNFDRLTTQDPRLDHSGSDLASGSSNTGSDHGGDIFPISSSGNRDSDFDRTSSTTNSWDRDSNRDSFSNLNRDTTAASSGNTRVEVEIQRLENKGGIRADGKECDFLSACDPKLYAIIDTDSPTAQWPGSVPIAQWPMRFEVSNTNSPTISKVITRDVCGASVNQVNLRVRAMDANSISADADMNQFECVFPVRNVGTDPSSAQWGEPIECTAKFQSGKMKLFARQRAYQISSSSCNASTL